MKFFQGNEEKELPLFPLKAVLFPGSSMAIHVFEERYKTMVDWSIAKEHCFGVALIKAGEETGEPAEPFEVGTVARITQVALVEGGNLYLAVTGIEPFRIKNVLQTRPYLFATVMPLASGMEVPVPEHTLAQASALFQDYVKAQMAATGQWTSGVPMPQDPYALSFAIASRLSASHQEKQSLLELTDTAERLRQECRLLADATQQIRQQTASMGLPRGFSSN